ncbi:MAG: hypothetical protein QOE45_619 [Frankiaceae bacterium]|jgi:hypothetical protein|nr:hypothetical protein [Frankiaceae bacterium]
MRTAVVLGSDLPAARRERSVSRAAPRPVSAPTGDGRAAESFPPLTTVRRWLRLLGEPDRVVDTELVELLRLTGRLPVGASRLEVGRAGVALLVEVIERRNPAATSNWRDKMPYEVLRARFVEGVTGRTAATQLGISTRQLTREVARAVELVQAELQSALAELSSAEDAAAAEQSEQSRYRFEPIPAIASFVPRRGLTRVLNDALREHNVVHVHGPAGIGKTSLLADLAANWVSAQPVLWYHIRAGVNDTLAAFLFELAEHLRMVGRPHLAEVTAASLPRIDVSVVGRVAVSELAEHAGVLVLDDYHLAEADPAIGRFLDDLTTRLPHLRVVTVGRHDAPLLARAQPVEMLPLTLAETAQILDVLAGIDDATLAAQTHEWTGGIAQLVALAAPWLTTASPEEITGGLVALSAHDSVQAFLLDWLTGLMDSYDRDVLEAASVFHYPFTDGALAALTDRSLAQISDVCRRLVRYHIASRGRSDDVAFVHTSIGDYIYERLSAERRRELHSRAAAWYRMNGNEREAAYHAERAGTATKPRRRKA